MTQPPGFGPPPGQPAVPGDPSQPIRPPYPGHQLPPPGYLPAGYLPPGYPPPSYDVEYMHRSGQTLGKKVMKIRVMPIDPSRTLTRGMAVKRYLVQFVACAFVPFLSYVDGLWQLWDKPYQQTLHDKAAQTVVVKVSA